MGVARWRAVDSGQWTVRESMRGSLRLLVSYCVVAVWLLAALRAQSATSHVAPGGDGQRRGRRSMRRCRSGWRGDGIRGMCIAWRRRFCCPRGWRFMWDEAQHFAEWGCVPGGCADRAAGQDAEMVTPGPHAWDGSYTSADFEWKGHKWRVESAHDGDDLVMLVAPLEETSSLRCHRRLSSR